MGKFLTIRLPGARKFFGGACAITRAGGILGAILWLLTSMKLKLQPHWLKWHSYPSMYPLSGVRPKEEGWANPKSAITRESYEPS